MYTVCWSDGDGINRWEKCESRRKVAALLIEKGLENNKNLFIFSPDAENFLTTAESIFAAL